MALAASIHGTCGPNLMALAASTNYVMALAAIPRTRWEGGQVGEEGEGGRSMGDGGSGVVVGAMVEVMVVVVVVVVVVEVGAVGVLEEVE